MAFRILIFTIGLILCFTSFAWAQSKYFTLQKIIFSPSDVFSESELLFLSAPYINKKISQNDLNFLINKIQILYQQKGFIFSRAEIDWIQESQYKARIKFYEPHIVIDETSDWPQSRTAIKIIQQRIQNKVFNVQYLQKNMLALNQVSGLRIKATIKPELENNQIKLSFEPSEKSFDGYYQIDNQTNDPSNSYRILTQLKYYNRLSLFDEIGVKAAQYQGDDDVKYAEIYAQNSIGTNGIKLKNSIAGIKSTSPNSDLGFTSEGDSKFLTSKLSIPFENKNLNLGFSYLSNQAIIQNLYKSNDKIFSINAGLDTYFRLLNLNHIVEINLTKGLDVLNADTDSLSRPDADYNFLKTELSYQTKYKPYEDRDRNILFAFNSQYAFEPLLASEEFSVGGSQFGKGYKTGQIVGDSGAALSITALSDAVKFLSYGSSLQFYSFADVGFTQQKKSSIQENRIEYISSAGIGINGQILDKTNYNLELAIPLYEDISEQDLSNNNSRFTFSISRSF
jgi:hemolysin activation/secretion protein